MSNEEQKKRVMKMIVRTTSQIKENERRKTNYVSNCDRDLQQLHKDKERLLIWYNELNNDKCT